YYFFSRFFCLTLITITNTTNRDNNPTTNAMNPQLNPVSSRITNTSEDSRSIPISNLPSLFFLIVSSCNKPLIWTSSVSFTSSISTDSDSLFFLIVSSCNKPLSWTSSVSSSSSISTECDSLSLLMAI